MPAAGAFGEGLNYRAAVCDGCLAQQRRRHDKSRQQRVVERSRRVTEARRLLSDPSELLDYLTSLGGRHEPKALTRTYDHYARKGWLSNKRVRKTGLCETGLTGSSFAQDENYDVETRAPKTAQAFVTTCGHYVIGYNTPYDLWGGGGGSNISVRPSFQVGEWKAPGPVPHANFYVDRADRPPFVVPGLAKLLGSANTSSISRRP